MDVFLNLSIDDGRIITSRLDASAMIPILRALGVRLLVEERLQAFLNDLATTEGYRSDRNFVVHGTWSLTHPENIPLAMSLRPETDPGRVVSESFPPERMRGIIAAIRECNNKLTDLVAEMETSRDKLIR